MKIEEYVMTIGDRFINKFANGYTTIQFDASTIPTLTQEQVTEAMKVFSDKVEVYKVQLKRVHLAGQNFPEWFLLFERELHNIIPYKGDTEEILDMQRVRDMFNSGIEAMEAALHLSKELK